MRRARKTDNTHTVIRNGLRAAGYEVLDLSGVGMGVWDMLVRRGEFRCWLEAKSSGGELTGAEQIFSDYAPGPFVVAESLEEAIYRLGIAELEFRDRA